MASATCIGSGAIATGTPTSSEIRGEPNGYDLKKSYGLSRDDYLAMHVAQDGKCAICGQPETAVIRGRVVALAVDHCHATGRVRGLLCMAHNQMIGLSNDMPDVLRAAASYLERTAVADAPPSA